MPFIDTTQSQQRRKDALADKSLNLIVGGFKEKQRADEASRRQAFQEERLLATDKARQDALDLSAKRRAEDVAFREKKAKVSSSREDTSSKLKEARLKKLTREEDELGKPLAQTKRGKQFKEQASFTKGMTEQLKLEKDKRSIKEDLNALGASRAEIADVLKEAKTLEENEKKVGKLQGFFAKVGRTFTGKGDPARTKFATKAGKLLANSVRETSGTAASDKERKFLEGLNPSEGEDFDQIVAKSEALQEFIAIKLAFKSKGLKDIQASAKAIEALTGVAALPDQGQGQVLAGQPAQPAPTQVAPQATAAPTFKTMTNPKTGQQIKVFSDGRVEQIR